MEGHTGGQPSEAKGDGPPPAAAAAAAASSSLFDTPLAAGTGAASSNPFAPAAPAPAAGAGVAALPLNSAPRDAAAARRDQLQRELAGWKKRWRTEHGREPTKRELLADPTHGPIFREWAQLGGRAKGKEHKGDEAAAAKPADG